MAKRTIDHVKLGAFVMAGLLFLIVLLYMIGKNRNLFGASFILKAQFKNVSGLMPGNNVRLSGIEIGTVKSVKMISDTVVEVTMVVQDDIKGFIRKNAVAAIGTDGLVGNKLVNIIPSNSAAPPVQEGDVLQSRKVIDPEELLRVLGKTNIEIALITESLKTTVQRINSSTVLWDILNEESLPRNLKQSVENVKDATARADVMLGSIQNVITDVQKGKGSLGSLLTDTSFAVGLNEAVAKIKVVGDEADSLAGQVTALVTSIQKEVDSGRGPANALLKDTALVLRLNNSLQNLEQGTEAFSQNMEALKHNFLFRGYFKKQERRQKQTPGKKLVLQ
jgi:phospholipid/cholesterol/gamma-HCH transport system substrate-binding protein